MCNHTPEFYKFIVFILITLFVWHEYLTKMYMYNVFKMGLNAKIKQQNLSWFILIIALYYAGFQSKLSTMNMPGQAHVELFSFIFETPSIAFC